MSSLRAITAAALIAIATPTAAHANSAKTFRGERAVGGGYAFELSELDARSVVAA